MTDPGSKHTGPDPGSRNAGRDSDSEGAGTRSDVGCAGAKSGPGRAGTGSALRFLGEAFQIRGSLLEARPHGSGHINDTYVAAYRRADGSADRYVHQRLNLDVFQRPEKLMSNISRVTRHIRDRLLERGVDDAFRRVLTLVPAEDGTPYVRDPRRGFWRTYLFIEGASTYDIVDSPARAYQAARAFGRFQRRLADLPGPRLHETIPDFHDTPRRFEDLQRAVDFDRLDRAADAAPEIAAVEARADRLDRLIAAGRRGEIPRRITHNDTKLNNVLIDDNTGEGLCVIDLDTTMPGLAPYDFGDMIRSGVSPTAEDERRLSAIRVRHDIYRALARGYLSSAGAFLRPSEVDALVPSGELVTLEMAIRFLTDHLDGDRYFKTHRPNHNLDRCRAQLELVEELENDRPQLRRLVSEAARDAGADRR